MEISIEGLINGRYSLGHISNLYFDIDKNMSIVLDKQSALEITHTLLDSLDLLDKHTEELIYKIEEKINGDN